MELTEQEKKAAKAFAKLGGLKGGKARAEALSPEQLREIGRKGATARWSKEKGTQSPNHFPEADHSGVLQIGGLSIPCAVLGDGTRVLTRIGFLKAIGRRGKAKGGRQYDNEFQTPVFLMADNLKPFISEELEQNSSPILYAQNKTQVIGYRAELLPQVCKVFLDAQREGALKSTQYHIAEACRTLYDGFATIGIIGLIDEATGYQEVRDRLALQAILDQYLRKEFAKWAKQFPPEFYQGIFRLRNWQWRGMKVNRPQIVAHYTKDLVYARLAPGILKELEIRNPMTDRGYRKHKNYQYLTEDIGLPALAQHLYAVNGLMRASKTWKEFMDLMNKAHPRRGDTLQLALFDGDNFDSLE